MIKRIAVDFDHTLFPTMDVWRELSGDDRFQMEQCHSWDHLTEWSGGLSSFSELVNRGNQYEAMKGYSLYPDSINILDQLQRAGHEIWIVTARQYSGLESIHRILGRELFQPETLASCPAADKVRFCIDQGISLIVEDDPALVREAHARSFPVTGLRWPYNSKIFDELNIPSAHSWADLGVIIRELLG